MKLVWLLLLIPSLAFGAQKTKPLWTEVKTADKYVVYVDDKSIKLPKPIENWTTAFVTKQIFSNRSYTQTRWLASCDEDTLNLLMISKYEYSKTSIAKNIVEYSVPKVVEVVKGSDEEIVYDYVCNKVWELTLSSK